MKFGGPIRVFGAVFLFAALWFFTPPAKPAFDLCGFHWLTGHACPLCGLTRAVFALAKGHWSEAIHFNALSPLAFVMIFGLFWSENPWVRRLWTPAIAAFAIYGVCRLVTVA